MSRYCPKCFIQLPEGANYCPTCGECMKEVESEETNNLISNENITTRLRDKAIRVGGEE